MNIRYLHNALSKLDEIKVIGKSGKADGVVCNVMGIVRRGTEMRLAVLQYDERFQQRMEEQEAAESLDDPGMTGTNRMLLRAGGQCDPVLPFQTVQKVCVDHHEFEVHGSESRRLDERDWEQLLLIAQFLNHGWRPDDVDYQRIDRLFLTTLHLGGYVQAIPDFGPNPELHVVLGPRRMTHQVEKTITLTVGGRYPDRIMFQNADTGEEHWMRIHRVYLMDVWEEMEKLLADPRFLEQGTSEEIARARRELEKALPEICPRGMYFPVVEYECEDDMSVQFHTKSFLDAKPANRSSAIGFIFRPEQPDGLSGLKRKAAVIQEPVPADTTAIEAEIFQCTRITGNGSLSFK